MKRTALFVATFASILSLSCTQNKDVKTDPMQLSLVKAALATSISTGQLAADAFCEQPVPYLNIQHADIDFQCTNGRFHWKITEERGDQDRRNLRNSEGQNLILHKLSAQRYRVKGSPCDQRVEIYIQLDDTAHFRQRWLKHAHCPGQDMKLAE